MHWSAVCLVLLNIFAIGYSARILFILPFPGKSHFIYSSTIVRALLDRGHQIVEYGPFPPTKPIPNYTHVEIHTDMEDLLYQRSYEDFMRISKKYHPVAAIGFKGLWKITYSICEQTFQHDKIKNLLNSTEHFDLVVTESTFGQESMLVFGHKFKAPTVTLQPFVLWSCLNRAAGNSLSIASIPDFISTVMTDHMSFKERAVNFASTLITLYHFYNVHLPLHQEIISKNYPGEAPSIEELVTNVSLYIVNSHPAVEYSQPYTPNIIPVPGISLTQERKPLPQDLQKFMDGAEDGVIYFSFGTVLPLHLFPMEVLQIFVNVFKKINRKVVWKIEHENITGLPSNVILRKWLPQPGILAHPNLALFLTHGGLNSQMEAILAGVPTVTIPFFSDQPYNALFNEHNEIGVKVDFKTLTEDTLMSALMKVLTDSRYKENALRMAHIFRDWPVSPADSVGFWTEYVLRHSGARHLQPVAASLRWYQLWMLDVVAVAIAAFLAFIFTCYIMTRKLLSVVTGKSRDSSRKKKN